MISPEQRPPQWWFCWSRQPLNAGVRVSHRLTGKTNLNLVLVLDQIVTTIDNLNAENNGKSLLDDVSYNARASLTYQLTSKISVGPYVGYGITDVSGSGGGVENTQDRINYSAGITGTYQASGKTAFTGSLGWTHL